MSLGWVRVRPRDDCPARAVRKMLICFLLIGFFSPERGHAYEQRPVDLATFRAVPASAWDTVPKCYFLLLFGTPLEREKLPNGLLPTPAF